MYKTYKDNNELFMSIVFRKHGDDLYSKNKRVYRLKRKIITKNIFGVFKIKA